MRDRIAGLLLPLSSLPGPFGIGTMGKEAFQFIDYLTENLQSIWQMLPIGPTSFGDSPYQTLSSDAISPYYIDLRVFVERGVISEEEIRETITTSDRVDYEALFNGRIPLLKRIYQNTDPLFKESVREFFESTDWVKDYALFMALKEEHNFSSWYFWEEPLKMRDPEALEAFQEEHEEEVLFWAFTQYVANLQWKALKRYANERKVEIMGDIPLYVAFDSVEVWRDRSVFELDERELPKSVAGCPPDGFSETGQLWGNPLYDWKEMKKDNFTWWRKRLERQSELYDHVRLDHFIGFVRYWSIPFGDKDASGGHWEEGPGLPFFETIRKSIPTLSLIAEDLGSVNDAVRTLRREAGLPSMRVFMFGLDPFYDSENAPHNYENDVVCYTGTHDNDTVKGFFQSASKETKEYALRYLHCSEEELFIEMLRALYASPAFLAMTTVQDLLGIGSEGRINLPNTVGNWTFRLETNYLEKLQGPFLKELTKTYWRYHESL
ncbi:4-alpha-glucanotransferase [Guggenheimella bovis]